MKLSFLLNLYPETNVVFLKSAGNILHCAWEWNLFFLTYLSLLFGWIDMGTLLPTSEECAITIKKKKFRAFPSQLLVLICFDSEVL